MPPCTLGAVREGVGANVALLAGAGRGAASFGKLGSSEGVAIELGVKLGGTGVGDGGVAKAGSACGTASLSIGCSGPEGRCGVTRPPLPSLG